MGLRWIGLGRYCSLNWDNHSGEQPQAPQATTPSNDLALTGCQNQAVSASGLATLHNTYRLSALLLKALWLGSKFEQ